MLQMPSLVRNLVLPALTLALAAGIAARAEDGTVLLLGGGSSFAAPIFGAWTGAYRDRNPTVDIAYDSIGSGEGMNRFATGSLDFAATDAPMSGAREAMVTGGVTHVPVTAGMVAIAYNLPDGKQAELRLPREVYADIFSGRLESWNDPRIAEANPGLDLPKRSIQVVARLDSSGTTYAFTNHLETASANWREAGIGSATRVDFPGGAILGRGNEGVAAHVLRSEGSIGYVEYGFAKRLGLSLAVLENASGAFVAPSAASGEAAIASAALPDDLKIEIPDPAGADAYPIVTFTWMLLRDTPLNPEKERFARDFTLWAARDGQSFASDLGYVPLPETVQERASAAISATN